MLVLVLVLARGQAPLLLKWMLTQLPRPQEVAVALRQQLAVLAGAHLEGKPQQLREKRQPQTRSLIAALALALEVELGLGKLQLQRQLGEGDPQGALLLAQPLQCRLLLQLHRPHPRLPPLGEAGALEARRQPALQHLQLFLHPSQILAQGHPLQLLSLMKVQLQPRRRAPQLQRVGCDEEELRLLPLRRKQHRLKKPQHVELREGARVESKPSADL